MDPSTRERACFEAGIKFGSLYHQFAGTPVSPASAPSLATAMEEAIENQPHCEAVDVTVHEDRLIAAIADGPAEYVELTGEFLTAAVTVDCDGTTVTARMELEEDGYPRMRVADVEE